MASSNRSRRIAKEIADIKADQLSQIIVDPAGNGIVDPAGNGIIEPAANAIVDPTRNVDDLTHLRGQFRGPPDTPYEGGTYYVDIKIPNEYPFRPPIMRFETKIWHPNVSSQTGAICLDTLSSQWSPVLTIKSALISLQSLLSTPEPKDPQDAEVAGMLIRNPSEFEHVARDWAVKFAGAQKKEIAESSGGATAESIKKKAQLAKENEAKVKLAAYHGYNKDLVDRFVAMGFDVESVVAAFEYVGIDKMGGEDYELEEAYMGDITARLFGES